jgi:hypothetical protein
VARSLNDGQTWTPVKVAGDVATGHQFFPDGDALDGPCSPSIGRTAVQDDCYSVQLPIANTLGRDEL